MSWISERVGMLVLSKNTDLHPFLWGPQSRDGAPHLFVGKWTQAVERGMSPGPMREAFDVINGAASGLRSCLKGLAITTFTFETSAAKLSCAASASPAAVRLILDRLSSWCKSACSLSRVAVLPRVPRDGVTRPVDGGEPLPSSLACVTR